MLPSLKSAVPNDLLSRMVYHIKCSGCKACYVGQTIRHMKTRLSEHLKTTMPVGEHLANCAGTDAYSVDILEKCQDLTKLMTLEALHIAKRKPILNNREEYRQRPLAVRL